jgi:hypothetical protein
VKDERNITEQDVYKEHMKSVNPAAHWAYLLGVLAVSFIAMVALIALLGGTA